MGNKVNAKGFRLGIYEPWKAQWFARDSYGKQLMDDLKIRKFIHKELRGAEVSSVNIEKAGEQVKVIINSGRPGVVIGKKGQDIDTLRRRIGALVPGRMVEISVQEVRNPEADSSLVAQSIAEQLEKRVSFKRAMKRAATSALRSHGVKGIKIRVSGRLGGAEIARTEWLRTGSVPLHTLRAHIDYDRAIAQTTYGVIGVSVWIYKGEYAHLLEEKNGARMAAAEMQARPAPAGRGDRRGFAGPRPTGPRKRSDQE